VVTFGENCACKCDLRQDISDFRQSLLDGTKPTYQKLPPKAKQKIVSADWKKQRALIIQRDNQRRQGEQCDWDNSAANRASWLQGREEPLVRKYDLQRLIPKT